MLKNVQGRIISQSSVKLITLVHFFVHFSTQLPKVGSGKSPISNISLINADGHKKLAQLRTVCDKHCIREFWGQNFYRHSHSAMAQNGSHSGSWELNYSDHWVKYTNSFWRI